MRPFAVCIASLSNKLDILWFLNNTMFLNITIVNYVFNPLGIIQNEFRGKSKLIMTGRRCFFFWATWAFRTCGFILHRNLSLPNIIIGSIRCFKSLGTICAYLSGNEDEFSWILCHTFRTMPNFDKFSNSKKEG